jgi:hypothetical protein
MTKFNAPLSDVIRFIDEQIATVPALDSSTMEGWSQSRTAVNEAEKRVQDAITERFGARFSTASGNAAVSIQGIRATSTMGICSALRNWTTSAEKRLSKHREATDV